MTVLYILYIGDIVYIGYILLSGDIVYVGDIVEVLSKSLPRLTLGEWEPFLVQIVDFPYSELLTLSFVVFPYNELLTIYLRIKRGWLKNNFSEICNN